MITICLFFYSSNPELIKICTLLSNPDLYRELETDAAFLFIVYSSGIFRSSNLHR